jgi:myo-inositol 2-dehydrogenase / D-chiro-inositol 1-dehydrogenase
MVSAAPMRAAVVGCGPWGQAHMRALIANPDVDLVAVCGRSADRTKAVAQKYGVRHYLSVESMVEAEKLDLATVSTGELEHFEPSRTLIEAGIPLLIEKSLTFDLKESANLVALARERRVPCGVNFNMRYLMPFQLMRQALDRGEIGRQISLFWRFSHRWPPPNIDQDVAVAITHHIHGLNLLLAFGGAIRSVSAVAAAGQDPSRRTTVGAVLTFASGAIGVLHGGVDGGLSNDTMSLECQGTLGRAMARDATGEFRLWTLDSKLDRIWTPFFADVEETNFQKSLDWHLADFITALKAGKPVPVPLEEGYEALRAAWAIIESANSGQPVALDAVGPSLSAGADLYRAPIHFREPGAGANATGYAEARESRLIAALGR